MRDAYILGIESSCDETSAAVVRSGEEVLSNVVLSQFATHRPYEGVVPELASREHLKAILPVVRAALEQAGKAYRALDALAVTQGPGLAGSLLVGVSFAKALAFELAYILRQHFPEMRLFFLERGVFVGVLASVLAQMLETSLQQALLLSQGSPRIFFTRPIAAAFMVLGFLSIIRGVWMEWRARTLEVAVEDEG